MEVASAAHAAHHFIKDEEYAMAVANLSHLLQISIHGCNASKCLDTMLVCDVQRR